MRAGNMVQKIVRGWLTLVLTLSMAAPSWAVEPRQVVPGIDPDPLVKQAAPVAPEGGESEDTYILQKGDRLKVTIYPEDEFLKGGETEISSEGNITLPLVGKVEVAGKNVIAAERAIAEMIDQDYLVDPEVVIEVLRFKQHSVILLGEVKRPGTYAFPEGASRLSLLQAIALGGGFSDIANIKKIKIVRKMGGRSKVVRANASSIISGDEPDIEVHSGDVINVMESLF